MGWGRYLLALGIVVFGLMALEVVKPEAVTAMVLVLILGVAISHPTFSTELQALSKRIRGGP